MRTLELLSPARNADIGIEAIRHGADAVYIGPPKFGARAAAFNSIADIRRLADFAHLYHARVYVTLNTLLRDEELSEAETLIRQLHDAGADALITQDPRIIAINHRLAAANQSLPLHASTQMDNRTPEKVEALVRAGYQQIVLARELELKDIEAIHRRCPDARLEVFVHGALCVSYSGCCYASEQCFGRSANRGECAQVCRMEFDLKELSGKDGREETTIMRRKHLLSLKDLCLIDSLQALIDSGATSFKIEGRLKDMAYVKNVTAAYSEALNRIVRSQPEQYERASDGTAAYTFTPDVRKSFNRGFTTYFLYGRNDRIFSFDTPKAIGEEVGMVKEVFSNCFTVAGLQPFANGDGLCYYDRENRLVGLRVNKAEGGRLYPYDMPRSLQKKTRLYRNYDKLFEDQLSRQSAQRTISADITITETAEGFSLLMMDESGVETTLEVESAKELARSHQSENIQRQMSKMGDTPFSLRTLTLGYKKNWFIPSSLLSTWRRHLVAEHLRQRALWLEAAKAAATSVMQDKDDINQESLTDTLLTPRTEALMTCRHCIRYSLGRCPRHHHYQNPKPMVITLANGKTFRLEFDCRKCEMNIYEN